MDFEQLILNDFVKNVLKDQYKTFDEWNEVGRMVNHGEKSRVKHDGKYYFHIDQTDEIEYEYFDPDWD